MPRPRRIDRVRDWDVRAWLLARVGRTTHVLGALILGGIGHRPLGRGILGRHRAVCFLRPGTREEAVECMRQEGLDAGELGGLGTAHAEGGGTW